MQTASWVIAAFTGALVVTTVVYTVMTRRLWQQTKRSYELSLFLHFLEFIKQAKGVDDKPWPTRERVKRVLYHPVLLFDVLNKAFPKEFKRFSELLELDKKAGEKEEPKEKHHLGPGGVSEE